jgi:hypothetical protein
LQQREKNYFLFLKYQFEGIFGVIYETAGGMQFGRLGRWSYDIQVADSRLYEFEFLVNGGDIPFFSGILVASVINLFHKNPPFRLINVTPNCNIVSGYIRA